MLTCSGVHAQPTTGLDPETRHHMWEVINKLRTPDRCIILTTHDMDEAQALCNRVGIIANGQLRCLGTPQHLRLKFTRAFKLKLNIAPGSEEAAARFIEEHVIAPASEGRPAGTSAGDVDSESKLRDAGPAPVTVKRFGPLTTYELPRSMVQPSVVFEAMRGGAQRAGITEWSLTQVRGGRWDSNWSRPATLLVTHVWIGVHTRDARELLSKYLCRWWLLPKGSKAASHGWAL